MPDVILLVDDEAGVRYALRAVLEDEGFEVVEAADGEAALAVLEARRDIAMAVADLQMPKVDGMALLMRLKERADAPRLVMMTAHGSERVAVEAMKAGALDYFRKPFEPAELLQCLRRALNTTRLERENREMRARQALGRHAIFRSRAMLQVAELVERAAPRDVTVLVTGETGTGKELVARAIVEHSTRARGPFVRFNCAALPAELAEAELFGHVKGAFTGSLKDRKGLFREAEGGTLFLDEVHTLADAVQPKLLRVLQEREVRAVGADGAVKVDVRVIAAANVNLAAGSFRRDLYYRLAVVNVHLPPLRDRREDIDLLADAFVAKYAERFGIEGARLGDRARQQLNEAPWPGNVRELEHCIERTLALSSGSLIESIVEPGAATAEQVVDGELTLKERVDAFERGQVVDAMNRYGQNQSETARRLGVNRATLIAKLKKYGLA
ncbi:MAG: sigma-54-dependent Fis family transcriptional regulator [Myxococcaceae bacterium]|nr:sigma-54-dependent Fis family transcriptional regulator [Myxococcaceae bacterium]